MGNMQSWDWNSKAYVDAPGCDFLTAGFSCKDLSSLVKDRDDWACYINSYLSAFLEDTTGEMPKPPQGSTLPALLGLLKYVMVHQPSLILMENAVKAEAVINALRAFLEKLGYAFAYTKQALC